MTFNHQCDDDDILLWGGRDIGAAIERNPKQALRLLKAGKIKCATKRDGIWTAWRRQLRQEFGLVSHRQGNDAAELRAP